MFQSTISAAGVAFRPFRPADKPQSKYLLLRVTAGSVNEYRDPDFNSEVLETHLRDEVLLAGGAGTPQSGSNLYWYRVRNGYMPSAYLQRVKIQLNTPLDSIPEDGRLVQVTVPYTQSMRLHEQSGRWEQIYRLYYDSNHWASGKMKGPDGDVWYRIVDHYSRTYYARAIHFRPVPCGEIEPFPTEPSVQEKHIEISISNQTLSAYEDGFLVKQFPISSGRHQTGELEENEIPTDTPLGNFHITVKTPLRHMGDTPMTDAIDTHAYPGVPWICFFHESGVGLHGAYWHNNFGRRMSSGCINLSCADALWLYRWTEPQIKPAERQVSGWGTRILVYD